jgi:hypothetical protein
MRRLPAVALFALFALALHPGAVRAADDEQQYPLGAAKLRLSSSGLDFSGRWSGPATMPNPMFDGADLRVAGGVGEGDSGVLRLPSGNWKSTKKGYVYKDARGRTGGIKLVQLTTTKSGGQLKVVGRKGWPYAVDAAQSVVTVTLRSGTARWCAEFAGPSTSKKKVVSGKTRTAPAKCPCETYATTWDAIQGVVFARNGCTNSGCHASAQTGGGLDLSADVAYENLVGVPSPFGIERVKPFQAQESFLWQKLAASTEGFDLMGKGSPMPSGFPALSAEELLAVRVWIQQGAPRDGVVPDTEALLGSCLPKPEPPVDQPLEAPVSSEGVQLYAPPWVIPAKTNEAGANGESEVCYSTYYNLTGTIPEAYVIDCPAGIFDGPTNPSKKCFSYDRQLLRQSANSHHSIIHIYNGVYPGNDPSWGYQCSGGSVPDGTACDPTVPGVAAPAGADCGGGYCRGKVVPNVACTFGYGPPDYQGGVGTNGQNVAPSFSGSQQPQFERQSPAGVFSILPIEGTIVWNSHAFNVFDEPIQNQQWLNLWYTDDRQFPIRGIFDDADIFIQNVPPFQEVEYCRTVLFPKGSRIADVSSHTHKRGRLFRVWGPGIPEPCRSRRNNPGRCRPEATPPIMVTTQYNDPAQLIFRTPLALDGDDAASRRFKFCAIFDNGYTDPATVKRNSTSPLVFLGGKCFRPGNPPVDQGVACLDGPKKGQPCQGNDRVCDSAPGANDGVCDACPLFGGVTTEDEMFILLGSYYCDDTAPGSVCSEGFCASGDLAGQPCSACPGTACVPYGNF